MPSSLLAFAVICAAAATNAPTVTSNDRSAARTTTPAPVTAPRAEDAKYLPRGQHPVQVLEHDLDGDGHAERIVIGESDPGRPGVVSLAIVRTYGKGAPELLFAQRIKARGLARAGAIVQRVEPIGPAVVLVGAVPSPGGNSLFLAQLYALHREAYRPLLAQPIEFRSQGGFSIEDLEPERPGDEIAVFSFVAGPHEQLYDLHHYDHARLRFDGRRFVRDDKDTRTPTKLESAEAAAAAIGVKNELRRRMPRVAEVP